MPPIRPIAAVALLLLAFATSRPQDIAPPPQLTIHARIVAVTAIVHDNQGHLLHDLNQQDFSIREDDHPVTLRYFDRDSDLPLRIGLMIDTSSSQYPFFEEERRASRLFLESILTRPQDQGFVVQFDNNVFLLQKPTANVAALERSLDHLTDPHPARPKGGGTLLFDAISSTAQQISTQQQGRRALIILTDGDDNGSFRNYLQATAATQFADTTVYTIFYSSNDPGPTFPFSAAPTTGRGFMEFICRSTGGSLFVVSKKHPIEAIYAEIEQQLRTQYRLGYTPSPSPTRKYHRIEVRTSVKHATVQARDGYFSPE